jgi:hypothetical protein
MTAMRLPIRSTILNHAEKNYAYSVAKQIMGWLLGISLDPAPTSSFQLTFTANLRGGNSALRLGDVLAAHPGLLQKDTGLFELPPVFAGVPEAPLREDSPRLGKVTEDDILLTTSGVVSCFPAAMELLETVQKRCLCSNCQRQGHLGDSKPGCHRQLALVELFVMLAHGVSDSLGAKDVSGMSQPASEELGSLGRLGGSICSCCQRSSS